MRSVLSITALAESTPDESTPADSTPAKHVPAERTRLRKAGELAGDLTRQPFSPAASLPALRAHLVRLADDDHLLVLCADHRSAQQELLDALCDELSNIYGTDRHDTELCSAGGDEPRTPRGDHAFGGHVIDPEGSFRYWQGKLKGFQRLQFPVDQPRPAIQAFTSFRVRHSVSAEVARALGRLARERGATMFMVVAAAFTALLARRCDQDEIVAGATAANGAFVLRTDLTDDPSFMTLLTRVGDAITEAERHQAPVFGALAAALEPEHDFSHSPLTDVMLSFVNARRSADFVNARRSADAGRFVDERRSLRLPGTVTREFLFDPGVARFDLEFIVTYGTDSLTIDADCRADLFLPDPMREMLGHFGRLLAAVSARPSLRLSELALLGDDETARLLRWGRAFAVNEARASERCLHELFGDQVAARPHAPAVRSGDHRLSYRVLDDRAGRVADALRERGVGPGVCVAVCMERSIAAVVAILGVIKAGGCYLPLDPAYPADRLAFMAADSAAAVLLTTETAGEHLSAGIAPLVLLDQDAEIYPGAMPPARPAVTAPVSPHDPAYIMYTSGSTGTPKGVTIAQRGIIGLVRSANFVRLGPGDRIAHVSNLSFDASTFEIWGSLLNGGELVILTQDEVLRPSALAGRLRSERINVLSTTSAIFSHTAREIPDAFKTVDVVMAGGAPFDPRAARDVLAAGAPGRLLNCYGPTENTMLATTYRITSLPEDASSVPIGRPIAGTYVYVLDRYRALAPAGVPGELYIGGLGLADGYVGRPELTGACFVPDPFAADGRLVYRTGDIVRWLASGDLEFLGRRDDQVKLRGYRIELGEIRARLAACDGVAEAAVVVSDDEPDGARLVAYFVPADPDRCPQAPELKSALARWLPLHMLPSAFVPIAAMPLTENGKLDLRVLASEPTGRGGRVAPRPGIETAVAEEWSRILRVSEIDSRDDFFDLGGDSLQATRVAHTLSARLGTEITVKHLFDHPTCEGLACLIGSLME